MTTIQFEVLGTPQPAGSKRAFVYKPKAGGPMRAAVVDANPKSRGWKNDVGAAAAAARPVGQGLLEGPLSVEFVFEIPRPQGHFGTRGLLPSAPAYPAVRPDVLKLARAVEDALTGVLWRDDSQIVEEVLVKRYGEQARLRVTVRRPRAYVAAAPEPMPLFGEGVR